MQDVIDGNVSLQLPEEFATGTIGEFMEMCLCKHAKKRQRAYNLLAHWIPGGVEALQKHGGKEDRARANQWLSTHLMDDKKDLMIVDRSGSEPVQSNNNIHFFNHDAFIAFEIKCSRLQRCFKFVHEIY